jgi:hypothetical protein
MGWINQPLTLVLELQSLSFLPSPPGVRALSCRRLTTPMSWPFDASGGQPVAGRLWPTQDEAVQANLPHTL